MKDIVIGIDIGGTNAPFNLVDREGNLLIDNVNIATSKHETAESFVEEFHQKIQSVLQTLSSPINLRGIGIGAPNGNYYGGTIEDAANLRWKGIVPFVQLLKKHYDLPIYLTNDANAAAIGEMVFGAAKGIKDFIVITLGTGLGSGIVCNGQLLYGHDGFAGEIGHTIVDYNGRQCQCGRAGCLETYVSATGIKRTVFSLLSELNFPSTLRVVNFNELHSKMISDAAHKGDEIALAAFDYTGKMLGRKLADSVAYTSPKAIFLFGGLANAGDLIFEPTYKYMEENLLNIYKNKVKLLPSGLKNGSAAILGASALVWDKIG